MKRLLRFAAYAALLAAILVLLPPPIVWGQSVVRLFGTLSSGAQKPVLVQSDGSMTVSVSGGTVPVANGGTGLTSYTIGDMLYASGTTTLAKLAAVATGQVLTSAGTGTAPAYSATPTVTKITQKAGGTSATFRGGGTIYWDDTDYANAADTNWVQTADYPLPAGAMATDGDRIEAEVVLLLSAFVSTKNYDCRIGHSAFSGAAGFTGGITIFANSTAGTSDTFIVKLVVVRQSATTASAYGFGTAIVGNALKAGGNYQSGASITWANAQNISCAVKDSTGVGGAGAETIKELRIDFLPRS